MKNSKRRGAVKVPNVILRPAQPSSSRLDKRQPSQPRVGLYEDDANEAEIDLNAGNKPFHDIVLCATGDLDKRTLFSRAQELGAIRADDFTDQVTHLVAGAPGSAKYKCAVERNLPILKPLWVEEAYYTWLNGGIVNLEQSIIDHRLPIFSGVRLCLTGIEDIGQRIKIHTMLEKEGGVYLKSLDKTTTHLLSSTSENSPKTKWANEYNEVHAERIHIIWEEWFWDSLDFRGRWNESEYEITNPRPARKTLSQSKFATSEHDSDLPPTATSSQRVPLPRSIPTASLMSDDPPELGQTNKQRDVGLRIFETIVQNRNNVESNVASQYPNRTFSITRPATPPTNVDYDPQYQNVPRLALKAQKVVPDTIFESESALARLSNHRVTSFARSPPEAPTRQPFRRIISSPSTFAPQTSLTGGASSSTSRSSHDLRFFAGYVFRAFGEAKGSALRGALEEHGGRWLTDDDEQDADFLIVRLVSGSLFWREEGDKNERAKYRTECWVERCIFEERICGPDEHLVFTPLKINTPVEGSENLYVSLSGLDSAETCWIKRLVRAIGGNIPATFSCRSTHLICPLRCGTKYDKAQEWGVNIVGLEWLFAIATSGRIQHPTNSKPIRKTDQDCAVVNTTPKHVDIKGKRRANETEIDDEMITDITNGASLDPQQSKRDGTSLNFGQSIKETKRLTQRLSSQSSCPKSSVSTATPDAADSGLDPGPIFGSPTNLLSGRFLKSPKSTGKSGSTSPPLQQMCRNPSLHPHPTTQTLNNISRRLSVTEIEQDKQNTHIPSSTSPSPLKVLVQAKLTTSPPISETRGLRTAITALLGKRTSDAGGDSGGPQKAKDRSSKRPRLVSRVKADLESIRGLSPALSFTTGSQLSPRPPDEEGDTFSEEQSSLRVIYEDPGQRAEKNRLIALFEKGSADDLPESKSGTGGNIASAGKDLAHTGRNVGPACKRKLVRRSNRSSGVCE